jgi:hypothetical protein
MFPPSHHPYRQPSRLFRLSLLYLAVLSNARSCPSRLTPLQFARPGDAMRNVPMLLRA